MKTKTIERKISHSYVSIVEITLMASRVVILTPEVTIVFFVDFIVVVISMNLIISYK
jgi:hypothetical protein